MNKPAFVFDGRSLVDAEELRAIGFKVGSSFEIRAFRAEADPILSQVAVIGRGERL